MTQSASSRQPFLAGDALRGTACVAVEPMDPETKRLLQEYFAVPNRRLAELLGRELPWERTRA